MQRSQSDEPSPSHSHFKFVALVRLSDVLCGLRRRHARSHSTALGCLATNIFLDCFVFCNLQLCTSCLWGRFKEEQVNR